MERVFIATCKNCGLQVRWINGNGWTHFVAGTCTNPVPIKDSIR